MNTEKFLRVLGTVDGEWIDTKPIEECVSAKKHTARLKRFSLVLCIVCIAGFGFIVLQDTNAVVPMGDETSHTAQAIDLTQNGILSIDRFPKAGEIMIDPMQRSMGVYTEAYEDAYWYVHIMVFDADGNPLDKAQTEQEVQRLSEWGYTVRRAEVAAKPGQHFSENIIYAVFDSQLFDGFPKQGVVGFTENMEFPAKADYGYFIDCWGWSDDYEELTQAMIEDYERLMEYNY